MSEFEGALRHEQDAIQQKLRRAAEEKQTVEAKRALEKAEEERQIIEGTDLAVLLGVDTEYARDFLKAVRGHRTYGVFGLFLREPRDTRKYQPRRFFGGPKVISGSYVPGLGTHGYIIGSCTSPSSPQSRHLLLLCADERLRVTKAQSSFADSPNPIHPLRVPDGAIFQPGLPKYERMEDPFKDYSEGNPAIFAQTIKISLIDMPLREVLPKLAAGNLREI